MLTEKGLDLFKATAEGINHADLLWVADRAMAGHLDAAAIVKTAMYKAAEALEDAKKEAAALRSAIEGTAGHPSRPG